MEKSASSTSVKVRNHIPDDLAFSILSKLPLKSLKRFGCVLKSWALLFENPHFMSIFRNNFISNHHSYYDDTSLLLNHTLPRLPQHLPYPSSLFSLSGERFENMIKLDWPNPFQEDDPSFYVLDSGSITGTLCLHKSISYERVVLWNPATEEFKVTPPSPSVESVPPYWDPQVIPCGFGYDHLRDDYKLIRYVHFFKQSYQETYHADEDMLRDHIYYYPFWEIYSLRSNSWRKLVDVDVPYCFGSIAGERLYMDGMCHWCGEGEGGTFVSSFDLSNEVFFTTSIDGSFDFRHLVVLNGFIALISWYLDTTTFHISILGEVGVKQSWTKLFIIGPLPCIERPIGVGKKGDIFFRKTDGELVWFDLSTQMIEELGIKGEFCCHVVIYKESLFPIGGINY